MSLAAREIPVIETERLVLRAAEARDLPAIQAFGTSERSHYVGGPWDDWGSWRVLLSMLGHWSLKGFGMWMVEERASGNAAGAVGFLNQPGWAETELGWQIYDGFEGKGLAHEAALAARSYGAAHLGLDGVISYVRQSNTRSQALAERLGAWVERDEIWRDHPVHIYRHPEGAAHV